MAVIMKGRKNKPGRSKGDAEGKIEVQSERD